MANRSTLLWRTGVISLLAVAVPLGIQVHERSNRVDTDAMLAVSVSVRTISHVSIDGVGDSVWKSGSGSGFLVSLPDCEVWTNQHVIEGAALIEVYPHGWKQATGIPATVVNATPRSDFAILRMKHCEGMREARLGDSLALTPGDETYAVGNPLGRNPDTITRGIISHTERYVSGTTPHLQTDAAINPGNSGGALFNRDGEVIGLNTAMAANGGGGNVGISYALPINLAKNLARELHRGPPSWGDAGINDIISTLTPDEAAIFKVPDGRAAVILTADPKKGPAASHLHAHDAVFRIDGHDLRDVEHARRVIESYKAGDTVTFHLVRDGEVTAVELALGEGWQPDAAPVPEPYDGLLGLTLETWSEHDDERGRFDTPVITQVQSLGPAHKARIASSQKTLLMGRGMVFPHLLDVKTITGVVVDGSYRAVTTPQDVEEAAANAHLEGHPLLLEIALFARTDPTDRSAALEHLQTAFFKVTPAFSLAVETDATEVPESRVAERPAPAGDTTTHASTPSSYSAAPAPQASP